jgi:hypothetical protein
LPRTPLNSKKEERENEKNKRRKWRWRIKNLVTPTF